MRTKVLMFDDDERYLELLKIMFEGDEMDIVVSTQGYDLSRLVELYRPDIVVMDILMHEHNGIELAQQYRAMQNSRNVPIIFMSAWTGSGEIRLPRNSSRIFKPFTYSELLQKIKSSLTGTEVTSGQFES